MIRNNNFSFIYKIDELNLAMRLISEHPDKLMGVIRKENMIKVWLFEDDLEEAGLRTAIHEYEAEAFGNHI